MQIANLAKEDEFVSRCFSSDEIAIARKHANSNEWYAGRFAAKEAVAEAMGTGFDALIAPNEIQIKSSPSGQPEVNLVGQAALAAKKKRMFAWLVSISHDHGLAVANAIALREDDVGEDK